jgi:O-antigen ligase
MPPAIATVIFAIGIVGLFILDRDPDLHTSKALWIPVAWLLIAGSRPISSWMQTGSTLDSVSQHNIDSNPINVVVFSVLLMAGLIVLVNRGSRVRTLLQANWPILLFFFYCALSILWSDYSVAASRKWIRSLGDPVMVLIVLTEVEPVSALKRLFARTGFVLLPLSVLLIKYYPSLGRQYSNSWELMYTGVTEHKNSLGVVCLVLGLGFFWRFLERYRTKDDPYRGRHLLADCTILTMAAWLFWMANSMTSLSCFLMAAALIAVTSLTALGQKHGVVHLLVAALVGLSLFALFVDTGGNLVASLGRNSSLTGRTAIWHQVLGLADNPLLGTGFESFWLGDRLGKMWNDNLGAQLNEAHNGYIEVYLNLGWIGVTLLAVVIVTGYRNVVVALRQDTHVGPLKLAYFLAAVIYSLTEAGFRMISPIWIFFLLATAEVPQPDALDAPNLDREVTSRESWERDLERVV